MKLLITALALIIFATATQAQYSVSGKVFDYDRVNGVARVQLSFTINPISPIQTCNIPTAVLTDREGKWSQTGFTDGCSYIVKPYKPFHTFRLTQLIFSTPGQSLYFYRY